MERTPELKHFAPILMSLSLLSAVSACGVDGAPTRPDPKEERVKTGLTITGEAETGVIGSTNRIRYSN